MDTDRRITLVVLGEERSNSEPAGPSCGRTGQAVQWPDATGPEVCHIQCSLLRLLVGSGAYIRTAVLFALGLGQGLWYQQHRHFGLASCFL